MVCKMVKGEWKMVSYATKSKKGGKDDMVGKVVEVTTDKVGKTDKEVSEMMSKVTESNILEMRQIKISYLRHQIAEIESGNDDAKLRNEIEIAIRKSLDPRAKYEIKSK